MVLRSLPFVAAIAQSVRAPDCGSGGRGFEPRWPPHQISKTRGPGLRRGPILKEKASSKMKVPQFRLFGFRRPREVVGSALGKLEKTVMEEAWRRGRVSASDIYRAFGERTAYTTWMTTLDRLFKKGLLAREKDGRAYVYSPRVSREEFERGVAEDVLGDLLDRSGGAEPLLACIVDAVSEHDRALLDELQRLVEEKRRELGEGE